MSDCIYSNVLIISSDIEQINIREYKDNKNIKYIEFEPRNNNLPLTKIFKEPNLSLLSINHLSLRLTISTCSAGGEPSWVIGG